MMPGTIRNKYSQDGKRALASFRPAFLCLLAAIFLFSAMPARAAVKAPRLTDLPETYILLAEADDPEGCVGGIEKNADEKAYPASIVKLLAALVALEHNKLTDTVTVSAHAVDLSKANAKAGIKLGEVYTLEDLLFGALLPSGCDCARAVADLVAGSEEKFAALMNEKAQSLGMASSRFANASGLHDENQYTTCRDLVRLGAACAENEEIVRILTTKDHLMTEKTTGRTIKVRNINRLIRDPNPADYKKIKCIYPYCIGGKTGSTIAAGLTYLGLARRGDKTLVVVLLGDYRDSSNLSGTAYDAVIASRFQEAVDLFEYGYSLLFPSYTDTELLGMGLKKDFSVTLRDGNGETEVRAAAGTAKRTVELAKETLEDLARFTAEVTLEKTELPVSEGERLGYVSYSYDGEMLFTLPLLSAQTVSKLPDPTPEPVILAAVPEPSEAAETPAPEAPAVVPAPEKTAGSPVLLIVIACLVLLLAAVVVSFVIALKTGAGRRKKK